MLLLGLGLLTELAGCGHIPTGWPLDQHRPVIQEQLPAQSAPATAQKSAVTNTPAPTAAPSDTVELIEDAIHKSDVCSPNDDLKAHHKCPEAKTYDPKVH